MLAISPKLTITSNAQVAREAAFFQMRNCPVEHDPFGSFWHINIGEKKIFGRWVKGIERN